MRGRKFLFWATVGCLVFFVAGVSFAQEGAAVKQEQQAQSPVKEEQVQAPQEGIQAPTPAEPDTQWLWGEVSSVDAVNNEIAVNYLDYETDNEKEIKVTLNDKTKYENVNSLGDIKLHDTVSVDYTISPEGKYIVKNISVEKLEEPPAAQKESVPPQKESAPENKSTTSAPVPPTP